MSRLFVFMPQARGVWGLLVCVCVVGRTVLLPAVGAQGTSSSSAHKFQAAAAASPQGQNSERKECIDRYFEVIL